MRDVLLATWILLSACGGARPDPDGSAGSGGEGGETPPPEGSLEPGAACDEKSICAEGACVRALDPLCDGYLPCAIDCKADVECRRECHSVQPLDCQACVEEWEACAEDQGCRGADGVIDEACASACDPLYQPCFVGASSTCSALCRDDAGCDRGRSCIDGFCTPATCNHPAGGVELCDGLDDDCDGDVDEGDICTDTGLLDLDLGAFSLSGTCQDVTLDVPPGASSFLLDLGDLQGSRVAACQVTDPGGVRQPLVEAAIESDGTLALLVPHTPRVPFRPGTWTISLKIASGAAREVHARALVREGDVPELGSLGLVFFLVGVPGLDAASAKQDPDFLALVERTRIVYRKAGVVLRTDWDALDVSGAERDRFSTIDSFNRRDSEVAELVALSSRAPDPRAVPVFLVHAIAGGFGAGIAPGIPGPAFHPGTDRSGVLVAFPDDWRERRGALGVAVAHEVGHMLGLFHTTEKDGSRSDPLDDTPECPRSRDRDGDGTLASQECGGAGADDFMFWEINRYQQSTVTPDQAFVIRRSPWIDGAVAD